MAFLLHGSVYELAANKMDLIRRLHEAIKNNDERGIQAAVAAGADMDQVWGMQGNRLFLDWIQLQSAFWSNVVRVPLTYV